MDTLMGPPEISPMSLSGYPPILEDDDLLPSWSRDPSPPDGRRQRTLSGSLDGLATSAKMNHFDDPLAPLSFSNVASLPSLSPKAVTPLPLESPMTMGNSMSAPSDRPLQADNEDFAADLTEGLQRRETAGGEAEVANDGRIQAFAKLEFDHFDIYIQKLSVVLGRRPAATWSRKASLVSQDSYKPPVPANGTPPIKEEETASTFPFSASPVPVGPSPSIKGKEKAVADESVADNSFSEFIKSSPPTTSTSGLVPEPEIPELSLTETGDSTALIASTSKLLPDPAPLPIQSATDIDLGSRRAISRQHARLYYDHEVGGWILEVLGRNGVVIEGHWRAKGQKTLLLEKTKLQIADRIFHFLLPTIDVYRAEGSGGTKTGAKRTGNGNGTTKTRTKGKGKGKGKTRVKVDDGADSSSLSEVSDSEFDLSPLPPANVDLVAMPSSLPTNPSPAALGPSPSPSLLDPNPSLPPLPARSSSLPNHNGASNGNHRPSRSPLPRHASLRAHNSMAPPQRAASRNVNYTEFQNVASPRPTAEPELAPTADELEIGRQRAEMIAQLLAGSGQGIGGKSPSVTTQATSRRPGTRSGKGKASTSLPPPPGKGPGKGKAPPPRTHQANGWGTDDDSDDSDDSSDDEDVETAEATAALVRKTPVKGPSSRAPSPTAEPLSHPADIPVNPVEPSGMAMKQPKRRASNHAPPASPAASTTSNITSSSLPPLPSSSTSLPLLPTSASSVSLPPPSFGPVEVKPDLARSQSQGSPAIPPAPLSASTTALPLAPPSAFKPAVPHQVAPPTNVPAKKSKSKSTKGLGETAQKKKKSAAKGAVATPDPNAPIPVDGEPAAEPTKPRPTPYAPAPHPPGTPLPTRAPADNPFAKPPYTYASLIAQALATSDQHKLTMAQIYDFITSRWPYFKDSQSGWQNSIRHNLVPARGFLKVMRRSDEVGKGAFWMMDPVQAPNFDGFHFRRTPTSNPKTATPASSTAGAKSASPKPNVSTTTTQGASGAVPPKSSSAKSTKPKAPAPTPASTSSAGSSTPGNAALSKPLPIVVGPIPDSYVRPVPPKTAANNPHDEVTAALLADPPIVLHEGKIILNPGIFAHLTKEQLDNFQAIPASKALQILQAFVVQYFKDKMRRAAAEKARAAKAAAAAASTGLSNGAGDAGNAGQSGIVENGTNSSTLTSSSAVASPSTTATVASLPVLSSVSTSTNGPTKKREREPDLVVSDTEPLPKLSKTSAAAA
ncbi:hypothetical protein JCM16303_003911 [Sporobolomyces ruberrimus]